MSSGVSATFYSTYLTQKIHSKEYDEKIRVKEAKEVEERIKVLEEMNEMLDTMCSSNSYDESYDDIHSAYNNLKTKNRNLFIGYWSF